MDKKGLRILEIDLSTEMVNIYYRKDLYGYLGGTGLAAKLFSEVVNPDVSALHPTQPFVLARGPLNVIFPVATKVVAVFRSPLTGEYGESHAGMRLGLAMRGANLDAIIVKGRASRPTYLAIGPNDIGFKDASAIWGLNVGEVGNILRRLVPGSGHRSTLRIGPGGETLVSYACVNVDTYRHFGRLGLGAIFGSKNLKAMVVYGDHDEKIENFSSYNKAYRHIYEKVVHTDIMEKYHGLGTSINVLPLNTMGALPTRNLTSGSFEHAEKISGEAFAKETLIRQLACSGCPIGCIHLGLFRKEFGPNYEYKSKMLSYDHELIFALGSFLGMSSIDKIYEMIDLIEEYGLDAISTGVTLGWATEALQQGIITEEQLGTALAYGDTQGYATVLKNIVFQSTEFYKTLAMGAEAAAEAYGGMDYCMTMSKTEMAGYHTGHAHIIGQTIGARHSHLDNAGYAIDQKNIDQDPEKMVKELLAEEKWRNVLTSLCICLFARGIYDPETVVMALQSIGIEMTQEDLHRLGQEIYTIKHNLKILLGYDPKKQRFPKRFFETASMVGPLNPETLEEMMRFYRLEMEKEMDLSR